jgi:hypothetical protein
MLHFAMGWNYSAHVSFRNGLVLLRPCFVLLVLDWTFVSLFNVVLVARLDFFILGDWILQPIYRGIGFSNPF